MLFTVTTLQLAVVNFLMANYFDAVAILSLGGPALAPGTNVGTLAFEHSRPELLALLLVTLLVLTAQTLLKRVDLARKGTSEIANLMLKPLRWSTYILLTTHAMVAVQLELTQRALPSARFFGGEVSSWLLVTFEHFSMGILVCAALIWLVSAMCKIRPIGTRA
ncbi:hypothetical protein H6G33_38135 [Calothrix sp. FACHB-1219]|nr:hypothetical protein [Calothrix sp. FACHB-1219]